MTTIKAYKVFGPDWKCRDHQFEVGQSYTHKGEVKLCRSGYHACERIQDCFSYYPFNSANKIAEVELSGKIDTEEGGDKICAETITIIRELSWSEMLVLANQGKNNVGHSNTGGWNTGDSNTGDSNTGDRNTGDRNTGDSNTGDRNTGDRNTGDRNTGDRNTGDRNTGGWNTGDRNVGFFNTVTPENILVFNKPCKQLVWDDAEKPCFMYIDITEWVPESHMTDEEKTAQPKFYVQGGYLKAVPYKEAWAKAWEGASASDRALVKKLPNFDAAVFEEITGVKV